MEGFVARRLLKDVRTADLLRRAVVIAPRLFGGAALPLLAIWILPIGAACALTSALPSTGVDFQTVLIAGQLGFSIWSVLTTPLLAGLLARSVLGAGIGRKPAAKATLQASMRDLPRAIGGGLAAGATTLAGLFALVIPGLFAGATLFVAGPTAAIEGKGAADSLRRSAALTHGKRWTLFAVAVLFHLADGFGARVAEILVPERRAVASDLVAGLLLAGLLTACVSLARAVASALAYADLRAAQEGVDLDHVASAAGALESADAPVLSDRAIDSLARRAPSAAEKTVAAVDSVRDFELGARERARKLRLVATIAGALTAIGLVTALVMGLLARRGARLEAAAQEEQIASAWRAWEGDAGAATDGIDAFRGRNEKREVERIGRMLLTSVAAAPQEARRALALRLLTHHLDHLYGPGFLDAWNKLRDGENDEAILAALGAEITASGCDAALQAARADAAPAKAFARSCPPDATALDANRVASSPPLTRAVFATLLAARAQQRKIQRDPVHDLAMNVVLGRP